jgi:hypothetical protein
MNRRISLFLLSALMLTAILPGHAIAQSERRTAYTIFIDNSLSLRPQFAQVLALARGIVRHIGQRDSIAIFNFVPRFEGREQVAVIARGTEWSRDRDMLIGYLNSMPLIEGRAALPESISSIAEELNAHINLNRDAYEGKAIILITDGTDSAIRSPNPRNIVITDEVSRRRRMDRQVTRAVRESGVRVYAIGLTRHLETTSSFDGISSRERAETFLRRITSETGGRVLFPRMERDDVARLIAELLAQ